MIQFIMPDIIKKIATLLKYSNIQIYRSVFLYLCILTRLRFSRNTSHINTKTYIHKHIHTYIHGWMDEDVYITLLIFGSKLQKLTETWDTVPN
jgi:hypothetical protein